MYSSFQLAKKYLRYYLTASNGKGHGIHSPFVFSFIKDILNDKTAYPYYSKIESIRKALLKDEGMIEVQDFGAGSAVIKTNTRQVKKIAASSLKPKKYAQLLSRMTGYFKPAVMLELGTSFGITSAYLAAGYPSGKLFTCEGASSIAAIAKGNFSQLGLANIELKEGDFSQTLPLVLSQLNTIDIAFVDGNHREAPTLQYFSQLLEHHSHSSIFIFDDIHWSSEMESAWAAIKSHPAVTCSIDLFFIGIIMFTPDFKVKQDFVIRY